MTDKACRVASPLTAGLDPVGWRFVPSEKWGEQVLTQDPKTVQLARDMGRDVEPLYTEAQMLARVAAKRERCAKVCEPTWPRPCDCERCDCGNATDARMVAEWDAWTALARRIREA